MRVAILTTSYPRSSSDDAGIFVARLVAALGRNGTTGYVIVPRDHLESELQEEGNFTIKRYRYGLFSRGRLAFGAGLLPNLRAHPLLLFQAPGLLLGFIWECWKRRKEYDLILANWSGALVAAWIAGSIFKKPYIATLRGEDVRLIRHPLLRWLLAPAIWQASAVTSINRTFLEEIRTHLGVPEHKLNYLPNGVHVERVEPDQLERLQKEEKLDPNTRYLISVGTVIPRKGIDLLVRVVSAPELKDTHLLLCGRLHDNAYVKQVRELAKELGCEDRVEFRGKVAPNRVPIYLASASAFVSGSEFEGRPNSLLEALAIKLPVVVTDISAHREIISHGENGFLFEASRPEDAAKSLARLIEDQELKDSITEAGLKSIQGLDWDATAIRFRELFERVLESSK